MRIIRKHWDLAKQIFDFLATALGSKVDWSRISDFKFSILNLKVPEDGSKSKPSADLGSAMARESDALDDWLAFGESCWVEP